MNFVKGYAVVLKGSKSLKNHVGYLEVHYKHHVAKTMCNFNEKVIPVKVTEIRKKVKK